MGDLSQILGMSGVVYSIISKRSNSLIREHSGGLIIPLLVLLAVCFLVLPAQAKYGGGTGTAGDPYLIYNANQMNAIGAEPNDWDKCFKLMEDIDLSDYEGEEFNIIGTEEYFPFVGVFDGNNHTVSNFTYDTSDIKHIGLFRYVDGGEIKNLGLIDSKVDAVAGDYVGLLVGSAPSVTITNCYAEDANVIGDFMVGGMVGNHYRGTITNCYLTGSVTGNYHVGGLVGENYSGTISNCYSTSSVTGTENTGGLIGSNSGHVINSYWNIETSGQTTSAAGEGKTTAQMMMASTFLNWGVCEGIWTIQEGVDYPRLACEEKPGDPIVGTFPLQGEGDSNNPYLVHTHEELNMIGLCPCVWDMHFKLMAGIDLGHYTGTEFNIIANFTGVFDGNDHTIANFTHDSNDIRYIGLFGYVEGGEIRNLGLIDTEVGAETGYYIGSLAGGNSGTITNCYAGDVSIIGDYFVGGLVGGNGGTITNCFVEGGSVSGSNWIGGMVGLNADEINNCYATSSVAGDYTVGGLTGGNGGTIANSYVKGGIVSGNYWVGGLSGYNKRTGNSGGTITNCYAADSVEGVSTVGGLVGYNNSGVYSSSFWDNTINPSLTGIGNITDPNVIGESTTNMQTESTFTGAGWDFVGETVNGTEDIMRLCEDLVNYPRLAWEFTLGDFVCPDGVNLFDYSFFAGHWQEDNCSASNNCYGTDFDQFGTVGANDLGIFIDNWLAGL
ncbi:MAG: GLUG motif-containing protein [Planctomycetota bacterium]|jgi:hypothetical protein